MVVQDLGMGLCGRAVGPRPPWVVGVCEEMYPDEIPAPAASVLATDEGWDWMTVRDQALGAAIDQTVTDN